MEKLAVIIIENRYPMTEILARHFDKLPPHKLYFDDTVNSIDEYNKLFTSVEFWNKIAEENILIIQHDSALLRHGIEDFYEFDFIGAPIKWIDFPAMNGGLSFRHKSAMIKIINEIPYNGTENEDLYFCRGAEVLNLKLPTFDKAKQFSCETIFNYGSLGFHAIEKYLTPDECHKIKNQYK